MFSVEMCGDRITLCYTVLVTAFYLIEIDHLFSHYVQNLIYFQNISLLLFIRVTIFYIFWRLTITRSSFWPINSVCVLQRVSECMHEAGRRLQLRTLTDAEKALEILEDSLLISTYSEKLLTMKGEALLMVWKCNFKPSDNFLLEQIKKPLFFLWQLEKYDAAIKLCEQTVDLAGKNSPPDSHDTPKDINFRIWQCHLMLKSSFYMGKLEEAIASLEKQEQLLSATKRWFRLQLLRFFLSDELKSDRSRLSVTYSIQRRKQNSWILHSVGCYYTWVVAP